MYNVDKKFEIEVIIPVYKPGKELKRLLQMLMQQTLQPSRILLVNTEEQFYDPACAEGISRVEVVHIKKEEFDHGGTRHMAASMLHGAFLLFMTQDAVPADSRLLEALVQPFEDEQVCAAYARQLPASDCSMLERYTRSFNYGKTSRVKRAEDLETLGIKTFFCSNVCAMYRRSAYEELGGFVRRTIFNEDMIFAGRLIQAGKAVAYCADAKVVHSHNYTGLQQFHRNFDLGVSQAEHPEVFAEVRSESEGIRMVRQTASWLLKKRRPDQIPVLIWQSGWKFIGYRMGKSYRKLPKWLIRKCTMNQEYWR